MSRQNRSVWMRLALAEALVIALSAVALLALLGLDEPTVALMSFVAH
jgi:phosphotransacetylase